MDERISDDEIIDSVTAAPSLSANDAAAEQDFEWRLFRAIRCRWQLFQRTILMIIWKNRSKINAIMRDDEEPW